MNQPDLTRVVPVSEFSERGVSTSEFQSMLKSAEDYLQSFRWCRGLRREFAGIVIPAVLGIFLFEIEPGAEEVDDWLWVIIGDLPPAYITLDDAPNPASALDAYVGAMREWVVAAKAGESVEDLIPVNVAPTPEFAAMLESRLDFIDQKILADYEEDLAM